MATLPPIRFKLQPVLVVIHLPDMSDYLPTTTYLPLIEELRQRAPGQPARKIPHSPIHILNDHVLLNIFYLFQLDVPDEYFGVGIPNLDWHYQRWWYKLAQIFIFYAPMDCELTAEDEEAPKLRRITMSMDEQFPILEQLYIFSLTEDDTSMVLPRTFQAPHLHQLRLWRGAALPIGSPLLTTAVPMALIALILLDIPPSAYLPPCYLLARLSLMPQLEIVIISFHFPLPNRDVERQLLDTPIMTQITLPNLRVFSFKGVSAYLEGLLAQISAPALEGLNIELFNQQTFTVPHLLQFVGTPETLSFSTIRLAFENDFARLVVFPLEGQEIYPFTVQIMCRHLDWQVSSAAQIFDTLQPVLSVVEKLTLSHVEHNQSSEWHNEVDRTLWHQLLRPFSNLKTLHVQNELVGKLAGSLQTDDGEPPLEFLPNLEEVGYSGEDDARDSFTPFVDQRQLAGHPVNLTMVDHSELSRR
ncbi:hypothetical protein BJV78DRAFT_1286853 [Lactifluus subvellereus]|nr:hypothetical protein BJV78DRAFT_1286853 [Lactifluus subvellereus]